MSTTLSTDLTLQRAIARDEATKKYAKNLISIGLTVIRLGLALIIIWIGAMKFTSYEAQGIKPFVENSPLMSFAYKFLSVEDFSAFIGIIEIAVGIFIALGRLVPSLSLAGGVMGIGMFVTTLSFMLTTPGIFEPSLGGFPALSITGQFVLKDIALLGACLWATGDSLQEVMKCPCHQHGVCELPQPKNR